MALAAHIPARTPPPCCKKHRVLQFRSEKTGKPEVAPKHTDRLTIGVCESETPINED